MMQVTLKLVLVLVPLCCILGFAIGVKGSAEGSSPISHVEGPTSPVNQGKLQGSEAPGPIAPQNGSTIPSPFSAATPLTAPPLPYEGSVPSVQPVTPPQAPSHRVASPPTAIGVNISAPSLPYEGSVPSLQPATPPQAPSHRVASPPAAVDGNISSPSPTVPSRRSPTRTAPALVPLAPAPSSTPSVNPPPLPSPSVTATSPPSPIMEHPVRRPIAPVASPRNPVAHLSPAVHPVAPEAPPPMIPDHNLPPAKSSSREKKKPVAAPPNHVTKTLPPTNQSPSKAHPAEKAIRNSGKGPAPSVLPPLGDDDHHFPISSPSASFNRHRHHSRSKTISPPPMPPYVAPSPLPPQQGPVTPTTKWRHNAPTPSPSSASRQPKKVSPSIAPSLSPKSAPILPKMPLLPFHGLPPPPPNEDCSGTVCTQPYTNTPPGSPCGCVWPMQVGLRVTIALYTFFPLVSQLAQEIASGLFVKQSQVRIVGANAATEQPEKTVVLIDLVPLEKKFDNTTAFLTYQRFWSKKVAINASYFGDYQVLYVRYPGLPPSPPSPPSDVDIIDDGPYTGSNTNARPYKPLGVDVPGSQHKNGLNGGVLAIIVLSGLVAVISCSAIILVLVMKRRERNREPDPSPPALIPSAAKAKSSGVPGSTLGSSSASLSLGSSMAAYTGSAKTFSISEIEKATENFDESNVLGEGGFGRVYSGVLDDGTKVAVKVLKRDDHQGDREFLAEIEMLSRLHHRYLVKLIGICTEEHARCLVYELISNGSLESHLHGVEAETSPLDWATRMKIALGAARGLAYLHEDSSPRVIHRDFKASNILLEHDFTPKVSDFGLARTALDEESRHISTRVMGTFGYVAPEYAMTGHLLIKSDVYSYGVVLLELLTGRKPVDMSQPPGQENLVAWARPLLTSTDGLQLILDPSLGPHVSFNSVAKVAAIASMCVQPEVSHRPFMGEVVQALKLVSAECDEDAGSRNSSREDLSDVGPSGSGRFQDTFQFDPNYDSGHDSEREMSVLELFSTSGWYQRQVSGSFRRHSSSGPLRTGRGGRFWQRMRRLSGGSASEHGIVTQSW